MATLFLFGAGASYGNPAASPSPPPLGVQLFERLSERFESAREIDSNIATLFRRDFEAGMSSFYETKSAGVVAFLRDMAAYFSEFQPLQGNYYEQLGRVVRESGGVGIYSTLNYELLLEIGLANAGFQPVYLDDGMQSNDVLVLKLHGSCNFLPANRPPYADVRMERCQVTNWLGDEIVTEPIWPASPSECRQYYDAEDFRCPAMAIYMPGKRSLFSHDAIIEQQRMWRQAVRDATRIFVIGCRLVREDDHIWSPLARANACLFYVGLEPEAFVDWSRERRRKQASVLAQTFEQTLPLVRAILRRA